MVRDSRRRLIATGLGVSVLLGATVFLLSSASAGAKVAQIPLDNVAGVWVREHSGDFTIYITGAPLFVNRGFVDRYLQPDVYTPVGGPFARTLTGQGNRPRVEVFEHVESGCYIIGSKVTNNLHPFAFDTLAKTQRYANRYEFSVRVVDERGNGRLVANTFAHQWEGEEILTVGPSDKDFKPGKLAIGVTSGGWRGVGGSWTVTISRC